MGVGRSKEQEGKLRVDYAWCRLEDFQIKIFSPIFYILFLTTHTTPNDSVKTKGRTLGIYAK